MFVRSAGDKFNLANFMRAHLYGAIGVLKIGNDILLKEEKIKVDQPSTAPSLSWRLQVKVVHGVLHYLQVMQ